MALKMKLIKHGDSADVLLDGRLPLWAALPVTFAVGLMLCVLASRLLHAAYGALSRRFGNKRGGRKRRK